MQPLDQLREIIENALSGATNLRNEFRIVLHRNDDSIPKYFSTL